MLSLKDILNYEIDCHHCGEYTPAREKYCRHCGERVSVPTDKSLWFIFLMLIAFFPVGAYYLYKNDGFKEKAKIYMALGCFLVSVCLYTSAQYHAKPVATQEVASSSHFNLQKNEPLIPAPAITPAPAKHEAKAEQPAQEKQEEKQAPHPKKTIQQVYLGNTNSGKFHRSSCRTIKHEDASHFIQFSSREEAVEAGYVACKVCVP